eukprot:CAMPEP_0197522738 /NCGR_PEP_ID=MMETSP1318-20131121/7823_1 /TAXON_ID=552666 /ORGANISM="Partenskyella glossopodia, Strain RCC365" /LENGTH=189 /DNA_ID=CAMNT_0043075203 /DNA_START=262 /DNA_END=831 /DNA_ORIENTATION=+
MSSPIFLGFFLVYTQMLKGSSYEETKRNLEKDWFTLVKAGWSVWPLAHCINFAFVPVHWRLLYVSFIQLGFGTFLSLMAHQGSSGIVTPVDMLYNKITNTEDGFTNKDAVCKVIGFSWIAGALGMLRSSKRIGLAGIGCGVIGGMAALFELSIMMKWDHIWAEPLGIMTISSDDGVEESIEKNERSSSL